MSQTVLSAALQLELAVTLRFEPKRGSNKNLLICIQKAGAHSPSLFLTQVLQLTKLDRLCALRSLSLMCLHCLVGVLHVSGCTPKHKWVEHFRLYTGTHSFSATTPTTSCMTRGARTLCTVHRFSKHNKHNSMTKKYKLTNTPSFKLVPRLLVTPVTQHYAASADVT